MQKATKISEPLTESIFSCWGCPRRRPLSRAPRGRPGGPAPEQQPAPGLAWPSEQKTNF